MEPGAGSVALRQAGQTLPLNRKCLEHIGSRHCLVASPARFERATFRLGGGCSILLSYGDICHIILAKSNPLVKYLQSDDTPNA